MRIEICGGIGAGKSTLANLINHNEITAVLENFKANPFWEPFYSNPSKYIFETEVTFLLQHYHAIKVASEQIDNFICDFSFYQDLAYAKMGLENAQLKIFNEIFTEGLNDVGQPDLLICLQCDSTTLKNRIDSRGRKEEQSINYMFLDSLNKYIYEDVSNFPSSKVLYINSKENNFASDSSTQRKIVNLIKDRVSI